MSSLMNAALFYGPGDVRFERIGIPEPGPGDVLVKIKNALTCGTDIKTYQRGHPAIIKSVPSTFGHEYSGEIVKTGRLVEHFKPGMRVVGYNSAPCQKCYYCKNNQHNLCDDLLVINGAYAEYMVIPERAVKYSLLEIPDNISFHEASLAEPLGTALHAIRLTEIKQGDTVVILKLALGLMLVRLAHLQGARRSLLARVMNVFSCSLGPMRQLTLPIRYRGEPGASPAANRNGRGQMLSSKLWVSLRFGKRLCRLSAREGRSLSLAGVRVEQESLWIRFSCIILKLRFAVFSTRLLKISEGR